MNTIAPSSKRIDGLMFALPLETRAAGPDELGTVLLVDWGKFCLGAPYLRQRRCVAYLELSTVIVGWPTRRATKTSSGVRSA